MVARFTVLFLLFISVHVFYSIYTHLSQYMTAIHIPVILMSWQEIVIQIDEYITVIWIILAFLTCIGAICIGLSILYHRSAMDICICTISIFVIGIAFNVMDISDIKTYLIWTLSAMTFTFIIDIIQICVRENKPKDVITNISGFSFDLESSVSPSCTPLGPSRLKLSPETSQSSQEDIHGDDEKLEETLYKSQANQLLRLQMQDKFEQDSSLSPLQNIDIVNRNQNDGNHNIHPMSNSPSPSDCESTNSVVPVIPWPSKS